MMFATTRTAAIALLGCLLAAPLAPDPAWIYTGPATGVGFGHVVAGLGDVDGDGFDDVAVGMVGVYETYPDVEPDPGRTFVFLGSKSGLSPIPAWTFPQGGEPTPAGDVNGDGFRDMLVRRNADSKAFLFLGSPGGFVDPPSTFHPDLVVRSIVGLGDRDGDGFGDAALIHAPPTGETILYLIKGAAAGLPPDPWVGVLFENLAQIAAAGDVNGDGLADLAISTLSTLSDGQAMVLHGQPSGLGSVTHWGTPGEANGAFGTRIAGAGDVDGDGFDDLLVSAPYFWVLAEHGKAYLYRGSASGLALTPSWTFTGAVGDQLGMRIASAGDVNGDGFSDVAVSAGGAGGSVLLFLGGSAGLSTAPDQILTGGGAPSVTFGGALASAGDVDADGASELVVGDPSFQFAAGRAYLFARATGALDSNAARSDGRGPGCGLLGAEAWLVAAAAALFRRKRASA